jgi:hypothetical protein
MRPVASRRIASRRTWAANGWLNARMMRSVVAYTFYRRVNEPLANVRLSLLSQVRFRGRRSRCC